MPEETTIAASLLVCLGFFFSTNLYNILKTHRDKKNTTAFAEIGEPSGAIVGISAVGTFVYFAEALLYIFLVFTNSIQSFYQFLPKWESPQIPYIQLLGLALTFSGYFMFIWSVAVRGEYATSWAMRSAHRLIKNGPYRYLRHPSYFAYFLMFTGFAALWANCLTLLPLIAIPGYVKVAFREERLLELRFGDEYRRYKERTGRFLPRLHRISVSRESTNEADPSEE